jgi:putative transposase
MVGKRHPPEEIASKLQQADELASKGKSQQEITRALGISVMTYHRWRKLRDHPPRSKEGATADGPSKNLALALPGRSAREPGPAFKRRLDELELENARLRKAVTDLLLEKVRLEEEVQKRNGPSVRQFR